MRKYLTLLLLPIASCGINDIDEPMINDFVTYHVDELRPGELRMHIQIHSDCESAVIVKDLGEERYRHHVNKRYFMCISMAVQIDEVIEIECCEKYLKFKIEY